MLIGTLALTGFPLLSGFYSKDAIIEFAYLSSSPLGNYAVIIGIFTAFLTSIYSWRLFFKTFHGSYNNKKIEINETHESPLIMLVPLFFLGIGALFAGFLFKETFIGHHSMDFWQTSIFFINEIKHDYIPLWLLLITPILVVVAIPLSFYYYVFNIKILENFKKNTFPLYNFLLNKWYIDELYDLLFVKPTKKIISNKAGRLQTGFIYDYAFVMLIGLSILLTYLILLSKNKKNNNSAVYVSLFTSVAH